MSLALGVLLLWMGVALIYGAIHGAELGLGGGPIRPWQAYTALLERMR